MRPALVLAGAGVAAVLLLTASAVVSLVSDPEIQGCAAATADLRTANSVHQDALEALDRAVIRARRDGPAEAGVAAASLRVDQLKREFAAARDEFALLCHYPDNPPQRPPLSTTPRELP